MEGRRTVEEDDDDDGDETEPGKVRLEGRLVWQVVPTPVLRLHTVVEPQVRRQNERPRDQSAKGRDVLQPIERRRGRRAAARHEREEADDARDGNAVDGQAALGAPAEDLGGLALERERIEHSGGGVEDRVARRPGRDEQDGVDD